MTTFFHAPFSRSSGIHWLLAELGVPFETRIIDIRSEEGVPTAYRAIQAHGKVPAIIHDGVTITERAAIAAYLADTFADAGLAPSVGDRRRGPYLSWLTYADSVLDPALCARWHRWEYDPRAVSFGALEDAVAHLERTLAGSPYLLGDRFSAADIAIGCGLYYGIDIMKLIPDCPVFRAYLGRLTRRPAFARTIGDASLESFSQAA